MKNLFIIAFLFLSLSMSAQKVYNLDKKKNTSSGITKTADVAIYHGKQMPVYKSIRGNLFIYVVSKSGNTYKKYLK
jgi:hypothetical protein